MTGFYMKRNTRLKWVKWDNQDKLLFVQINFITRNPDATKHFAYKNTYLNNGAQTKVTVVCF